MQLLFLHVTHTLITSYWTVFYLLFITFTSTSWH